MDTIAPLFLITRTEIKSRTSSISGQIELFPSEFLALERRNFFPYTCIYNGENVVDMIAPLFLIGLSSDLQIIRTG